MKDSSLKACVAMVCIVGAYAVYAFTNPAADGAVFAGICTAIGALGGYTVAVAAKKDV